MSLTADELRAATAAAKARKADKNAGFTYWIKTELDKIKQRALESANEGKTTVCYSTHYDCSSCVFEGRCSSKDIFREIFPGCWVKFQRVYDPKLRYQICVGWVPEEEAKVEEEEYSGGMMGYEDDDW